MTDSASEAVKSTPDTFVWHPEYIGESYESVRRQLEDDIERDQRAYNLALEEAEKEEFGAFNSVRELEKRWSDYDFGWAEVPPKYLADRILAFERARDERQELISWQDWKAEAIQQPEAPQVPDHKPDWRENLTDEQRKRLASALSIAVLFGMALLCVGAYMLLR